MTLTTRLLAITGASGSGKSTVARALVGDCNRDSADKAACLLSLDAYYRDLSDLSITEREQVDFDNPDAVEFALFQQHLESLRCGMGVPAPRYDFSSHTRVKGASDTIGPARLVVADGLLLGAWRDLAAVVDHIVFVETPLDLCLQRRMERDCGERGRTPESVHDFWETRALPAFLAWSEAARAGAHLVVSGESAVPDVVHAIRRAFGI